MNKKRYLHTWPVPGVHGYLCHHTGKVADYVWTDHSRVKTLNACFHCTGETRNVGDDLAALEAKRRIEDEAE